MVNPELPCLRSHDMPGHRDGVRAINPTDHQRQGHPILKAVQAQQRAFYPQGQHRPQAVRQLRCQLGGGYHTMQQVDAGPHSGAVVLVRRPLDYLPVMRLPNVPPGLPHQPVPGLRGTTPAYIRTCMHFTILLHCWAEYPCQTPRGRGGRYWTWANISGSPERAAAKALS